MPVTLSDFIRFPFNGGKGIRTNQLFGAFVKSVNADGTIVSQAADGTESSASVDDVSPKLARYPSNPAATPAAHLEPYTLVGAYQTATYSEPHFDTFNIADGAVMISPTTMSGTRHGVLIGLRPEDADIVQYAEAGLSLSVLRASDGGVVATGNAASVSNHINGTKLLVSISDHMVMSFGADEAVRIEFGNKIALQLNSASGGITDLETNVNAQRLALAGLEDAFPDPIIPSHQATARILGLGLPADSGQTTWEDITDAVSGGSGGTDATARAAAATAQTAAENALAAARLLRPISLWRRHVGAQTVTVHWTPLVAVASGTALQVTVGGTPVVGVTTPRGLAAGDRQGVLLDLSVTQTNAQNIDNASNTSSGYVEVQITLNGVSDTTWLGVHAGAVFRPITTAASPYTVSAHDNDFRFEVDHGQTEPRIVDVAKAQLTPGTAKSITFAQNRTNQQGTNNISDVRLTVTLSANERQIATSFSGTGSGQYTVAGVYAR